MRAKFDIDRAMTLRASGQSYKAMAAVLGVSVGTIHEALRRLQKTSPEAPSGKA